MHQNVLAEQVSEGFWVWENNVDVVDIVCGSSVLLLEALGVEEVVGDRVARRGRLGGSLENGGKIWQEVMKK